MRNRYDALATLIVKGMIATVTVAIFFHYEARQLANANEDCTHFQHPQIPQRQVYSADVAICLTRNGRYSEAVREFSKRFSSDTKITQANAAEASIYSSVLAETQGVGAARPWWREILHVYFSSRDISSAKPDRSTQSADQYGTALALNGHFRQALSSFVTYAKSNIVGMRSSIFDDDRDLSDRIVVGLLHGSHGQFRSCYVELQQISQDGWDQYRSFYGGVCAYAAGMNAEALREWLRASRTFSICCGSTTPVPGNSALASLRLLYAYFK